jgi:PAS domain-containing protein
MSEQSPMIDTGAFSEGHTELYRRLVEDTSSLICRFLPDSTLTFVNAAYARFFDKRPEELAGRKFLDLIPSEEDRRAIRARLTAGIAHGFNNMLILSQQGYRVLPAESGATAMEQWKAHAGVIDLLLTDRVLPGGISGNDLAGRHLSSETSIRRRTVIRYRLRFASEKNEPYSVPKE